MYRFLSGLRQVVLPVPQKRDHYMFHLYHDTLTSNNPGIETHWTPFRHAWDHEHKEQYSSAKDRKRNNRVSSRIETYAALHYTCKDSRLSRQRMPHHCRLHRLFLRMSHAKGILRLTYGIWRVESYTSERYMSHWSEPWSHSLSICRIGDSAHKDLSPKQQAFLVGQSWSLRNKWLINSGYWWLAWHRMTRRDSKGMRMIWLLVESSM